MAKIKGITVKLLSRVQTGTDAFNRPVYAETEIDIDNVLVAPLSTSEVLDTLNLTGHKAQYQLAIPKGDTHEWENQRVKFFGQAWQVIGSPLMGIEANIPLEWNTKIRVEKIDG